MSWCHTVLHQRLTLGTLVVQAATKVERALLALPVLWARRAGQEPMGRMEAGAPEALWDAMAHQVSTAMMVSLACPVGRASAVALDPTGKNYNFFGGGYMFSSKTRCSYCGFSQVESTIVRVRLVLRRMWPCCGC